MKQTREDIIDLWHQLKALEQKAACREVNCEVLDNLQTAIDAMENAFITINNVITDSEQ
jgi:hypothetical protein|nr:MAG TPA: hypothetical protein [Bacteriophage sp.]